MTGYHARILKISQLNFQNVLLTKDNPPNVKVADFGLAKASDSHTMLKVRIL